MSWRHFAARLTFRRATKNPTWPGGVQLVVVDATAWISICLEEGEIIMQQITQIAQPPRSAHQLASDLLDGLEAGVETIKGLRAILALVRRDEQCSSYLKDICTIGLGQAEFVGGNLEDDMKQADAELFELERVATQSGNAENVSRHEGGAA
ncbi:hypothetical protein L4O78_002302 [Pseudomonas aeruginosa]|uniref:hypothetical protein n=2 Tax=Pseudomonas aeruginosa TaxID=287 RepID=UPI0007263E97|nr:hypothetical protein [Pseudomonas aeruginosa]MBF2901846.1 hypothetical protein [Pseudomonas aeruginosa]MBF3040463.1 hypothetical protein [Pseudomonas aeruginosa]MDY7168500.1 hypothetical protein [Pseudomonas aeruginosa]